MQIGGMQIITLLLRADAPTSSREITRRLGWKSSFAREAVQTVPVDFLMWDILLAKALS
jgi:hypothetical protein